MIYEFNIRSIRDTTIPVKADTLAEAQDIFDRWYDKHEEEDDQLIENLLENANEVRAITNGEGRDEDLYDYGANGYFFLPEEKCVPLA